MLLPLLQIWLGGTTNQTRLAEVFADKVKLRDLESMLEPLLYYYKGASMPGEAFGDFTARVGFAKLREYAKNYVPVDAIRNNGSATVSLGWGFLKSVALLIGLYWIK